MGTSECTEMCPHQFTLFLPDLLPHVKIQDSWEKTKHLQPVRFQVGNDANPHFTRHSKFARIKPNPAYYAYACTHTKYTGKHQQHQ